MSALARFDLMMNKEDKATLSSAAAIMGTTLAAFVRSAAKEKATELLEREHQITLSQQDMQAFTMALTTTFTPNSALKSALKQAQVVRRV